MTTTNTYGRQVVVPLTNKSGGGVIAGDVVVVDTTNNDAFTTSTAGAFTGLIGIAQETIASNATGRVLTAGYAALVNVNASVTRGNFGKSHTVVKQATDAGSSRVAGTFCQFLTGGTTPDAHLFGLADNTSGAGTGTVTTIKDEGSNLSTAVVSIDFVGGGVTATGTTAVTVTVNGGWGNYLLIPHAVPFTADAGTWAIAVQSGEDTYPLANYALSCTSGAVNDAVSLPAIAMDAGTWAIDFVVRRSTNTGIVTIKVGGSSVGTIDTYVTPGGHIYTGSITGISIATSGSKTLQLVMATKNASSSAYFAAIFTLNFRRTA